MPIINELNQRLCIGGGTGDYLWISGGYLEDTSSGVVFHGNDGCTMFYEGVDISTNVVVSNAAYQLFGTIHIDNGWANNGFDIDDFNHEYGHYIQEQQMGTSSYIINIGLPSAYDVATGNSEHMSQPYEIEATNLGNSYYNNH